jgi:hypothetical protein
MKIILDFETAQYIMCAHFEQSSVETFFKNIFR